MAPVNNFFQFDEDLNNIMGTFDYSNNLTRIGGLLKGKASSNLHNKLFYQVSTMVAGIGQMMCNKGYDMDDSSISTLITQLSNIMTQADMSIYSTTAQMMAAIASALGSYSTTSQMNTAIANAIKGLGGDNLSVAQVNALIAAGQIGVGIGQVWTSVTSARALGADFVNNSNKPIAVKISVASQNIGSFSIYTYINDVSLPPLTVYTPNAGFQAVADLIVPAGATYKFVAQPSSGSAPTLFAWWELR